MFSVWEKLFSSFKNYLWVLFVDSVVCAFKLPALLLNQFFVFVVFEFRDDQSWSILIVLRSDTVHTVKSDGLYSVGWQFELFYHKVLY